MSTATPHELIKQLPKAELHLHIEGTFEPELMFEIAQRNGVKLKYSSVEELRSAYNFNNLQEFLDIYYEGANVLLHEQDFYDLTLAYLTRCHEENIVHTEIFFDPQTHKHRGIKMETVVKGISKALDDAREKWGITSLLIPNFLRHLSEEDAISTFHEALNFKDHFIAFGLDSSEVGHPPAKFEQVFNMVRKEGFLAVAHAGEEGPAQNISNAIRLLKVARIDHGVRSVDDAELMRKLAQKQMPLTVCPQSNLKLQVVKKMEDLPLRTLLDNNILVTINSDDPAYFGGYLNKNFEAIIEAFEFTNEEVKTLAKNSFTASFLPEAKKEKWIAEIEKH